MTVDRVPAYFHGYEQVAHEILHETVVRELPALERALQQLLLRCQA